MPSYRDPIDTSHVEIEVKRAPCKMIGHDADHGRCPTCGELVGGVQIEDIVENDKPIPFSDAWRELQEIHKWLRSQGLSQDPYTGEWGTSSQDFESGYWDFEPDGNTVEAIAAVLSRECYGSYCQGKVDEQAEQAAAMADRREKQKAQLGPKQAQEPPQAPEGWQYAVKHRGAPWGCGEGDDGRVRARMRSRYGGFEGFLFINPDGDVFETTEVQV